MVLNVMKNIKAIHKEDIVLLKIGGFYHTYGRDAYIISYLFGYRIKIVEDNISTCGFPVQSLNKIIAKLEEKKINYIVLDRRNDYEVDLEFDFGNLNSYSEIYEKAKIYVNYKRRIDNINNFLLENIQEENFKEILKQMEEVIDERRKVQDNPIYT